MVELSGGVRLGHHRKQQEGRYSTYLFAPGREDPWVDPGEFLNFWTQMDADFQDSIKCQCKMVSIYRFEKLWNIGQKGCHSAEAGIQVLFLS